MPQGARYFFAGPLLPHPTNLSQGVALEGTYYFSDTLEFDPDDWQYLTAKDRQFWREHNAFIVPPIAAPMISCIIPDYSGGKVLDVVADPESNPAWTIDGPKPDDPHHLRFVCVHGPMAGRGRIAEWHPCTRAQFL